MANITVAEVPAKTYLSKSKIRGFDYVLNPYVGCPHQCVYCYAEYMRKFSGHTEPWGQFLDVKQCAAPLKPSLLYKARVLLSSVTDPYNAYEPTYNITRGLLKQLIPCQSQVKILTKSALVIRDIPLFKQFQSLEVALSFSSADEHLRALAEPQASTVEDKILALKTLHENGLRTAVMVAPLFALITDWKKIIELTRPYTDFYGFDCLNLRPAYCQRMLNFVAKHYPQHRREYEELYVQNNPTLLVNLSLEIKEYCQQNNISAEVYFDGTTHLG